ncbi:MAG: MEKHLA domain-containing protein [Deltaproteobacteria bacterium]
MPPSDMPEWTPRQRRSVELIAKSFRGLTGKPLVPSGGDIVEALWIADSAIVAHGTEADPVFFFGNRTALRLFEMTFDAFTCLPSRLSAEPMLREERQRLLERVTRSGIIDDYAGVRISASGRRFRILNASVWNLTDEDGRPAGQAAAFSDWVELS